MVLRYIYWVVEELGCDGSSRVTGVYTSIPDLIENGFRRLGGDVGAGFRLSLCKLDSNGAPLHCWRVPCDSSIGEDLKTYVESGEISQSDHEQIVDAVGRFASM